MASQAKQCHIEVNEIVLAMINDARKILQYSSRQGARLACTHRDGFDAIQEKETVVRVPVSNPNSYGDVPRGAFVFIPVQDKGAAFEEQFSVQFKQVPIAQRHVGRHNDEAKLSS